MASETRTCKCGASFDVEVGSSDLERQVASWRKLCPACVIIQDREIEEERKRRDVAAREAQWKEICPPLYADTDQNHSGLRREYLTAAVGWDVRSQIGLGFIGVSGGGKTRSLFVALRRAFDSNLTCRTITHNAFSKTVLSAFSGEGEERRTAQKLLGSLQRTSVLLLDDLGKAPSTDRADAELEELIETRAANKLPLLWSANGGGEWLAKRFGEDRGDPIVRRLAEFSTVVKG